MRSGLLSKRLSRSKGSHGTRGMRRRGVARAGEGGERKESGSSGFSGRWRGEQRERGPVGRGRVWGTALRGLRESDRRAGGRGGRGGGGLRGLHHSSCRSSMKVFDRMLEARVLAHFRAEAEGMGWNRRERDTHEAQSAVYASISHQLARATTHESRAVVLTVWQ